MTNILSLLNWKLRKHIIIVQLLNISIPNTFEEVGFELLKFNINNRYYSLLSFMVILPNGHNRRKLQCWGDILFLREPTYNFYLNLKESIMWERDFNKAGVKFNKQLVKILDVIFK